MPDKPYVNSDHQQYIDSCVLMDHPKEVFEKFDHIFLSGYVAGEMDNLRKNGKTEETKFQARRACRYIDENEDKITYLIHETDYDLPEDFNKDNMDNKIISILYKMWKNDNTFIAYSNDILFRQKCKKLGIPYSKFEVDIEEDLYSGIRETWITEQEYNDLLEGLENNPYNLYLNEYLIVHTTNKNRKYLHMWDGNNLEEVKARSITNSYLKIKKQGNDELGKILPLDIYQRAFMHMLQNDNARIKITDSIYGAGKSFLMINWAIQMLEKKKYRKMYFIKSDSPPKNRKEYPAIPGGINEKSDPLLSVINDSLSDDKAVKTLIDNNQLEIVPIQFTKGRSLKNSIFYINEVQDFTSSEIERILSRLGEGSIALVDGSTDQIDNKNCIIRNGLTVTSLNFRDKSIAAQVNMVEDFRSEISKMVSEMDWHD